MLDGKSPEARAMAACTSCAAASMLRFSSNCRLMSVSPVVLDDVIFDRPGIIENTLSSGVATVEAITSALAPGRCACTVMLGYSTSGRLLTGSVNQQIAPK